MHIETNHLKLHHQHQLCSFSILLVQSSNKIIPHISIYIYIHTSAYMYWSSTEVHGDWPHSLVERLCSWLCGLSLPCIQNVYTDRYESKLESKHAGLPVVNIYIMHEKEPSKLVWPILKWNEEKQVGGDHHQILVSCFCFLGFFSLPRQVLQRTRFACLRSISAYFSFAA